MYCFRTMMALLHPLMPFVTERLWQALPHEGPALIAATWPATHAHADLRALHHFEVRGMGFAGASAQQYLGSTASRLRNSWSHPHQQPSRASMSVEARAVDALRYKGQCVNDVAVSSVQLARHGQTCTTSAPLSAYKHAAACLQPRISSLMLSNIASGARPASPNLPDIKDCTPT